MSKTLLMVGCVLSLVCPQLGCHSSDTAPPDEPGTDDAGMAEADASPPSSAPDAATSPPEADAGGGPAMMADAEPPPAPDAAMGPGPEPSGADPAATISITGGDFDCLEGFLASGSAGAYAGFAGSSDGAYFIWRDRWDESAMSLRIETWDAFGGMTGPGSYTTTEGDTNYADCAVCIFAETEWDGEFWLAAGSTVHFTELTTGPGGVGSRMSGTIQGTLSNDLCSGAVEIAFSGITRNMSGGPL